MKTILQILQYCLIIISWTFLFLFFVLPEKHDFILFSIGSIWLNNTLYALKYFRRRVIFFFFNITFFVFLLARPFIDFFKGRDWYKLVQINYWKDADVYSGMLILLLALYAIWIGALLGNQYLLKKHNRLIQNDIVDVRKMTSLRLVSIVLFLFALSATALLGMEKINFMKNNTYIDYYISFKSQIPYVFYIISTFMEFSLFVFLATYPTKKQAFLPLAFFVLVTIPDLIVGERNPIVLNTLLALTYYILRDFYKDKKMWMGKFENFILIMCMPIGMTFLGIYNYVREGTGITEFNIGSMILDLFYKQGVTFSWFCSGLGVLDKLQTSVNVNYTFGGIIDYFRYGSIGQLLTGTTGLGSGNNILKATQGNSMSHHLSYVLLGDRYLEGHGCGSSFLLEVFADSGYIGVIIFCTILGFLLIYLTEIARKGAIWFVAVLSSIQGIYFMPRAEAISGIQFFLRMPFWITVILCFTGALLIDRRCRINYMGRENELGHYKQPKNDGL